MFSQEQQTWCHGWGIEMCPVPLYIGRSVASWWDFDKWLGADLINPLICSWSRNMMALLGGVKSEKRGLVREVGHWVTACSGFLCHPMLLLSVWGEHFSLHALVVNSAWSQEVSVKLFKFVSREILPPHLFSQGSCHRLGFSGPCLSFYLTNLGKFVLNTAESLWVLSDYVENPRP